MGRLLTAYTGFGFGVPTVIVFIVAAILQLVPQMKNVVIPGYNKSCVVSGGKPYLLYVSMINTALYIINLVFAGLTLKSLWAASKMASKLTTSRKESSRNK
ncbi:unnamed protein product [Allacma fusca]|uniref:Uncharacterized protein n=1 Tax=Allacma fusca TaxID=39272 RepID=A0A8J2LD43_9HEXA|nr:unnamed protein product [Allacma fusca]